MAEGNGAMTPSPAPDLKPLDKLVGTWKVSGGQGEGQTTYEWMEGDHFLMQQGELNSPEHRFTYIQIIGHDHSPENSEPSPEIIGRLYTSRGDTLWYTSEADDKSMTIWHGPKGSPAVYHGEWSDDGNMITRHVEEVQRTCT